MAKSNRREVQDRRREKKEKTGRVVKDKFNNEEQGCYIAKPVQAKNEVQVQFLQAIHNKQVTCFLAPAGCGKSLLTMATCTDFLKKGIYNKISISRPSVGMGSTLGLIPGDLRQKYELYLLPLVDVIVRRYGRGFYESSLGNGSIELIPLEYIRGRSLNDLVILDESQNVTPEEMYTILTRIEEGGKLIIIGDPTQTDLRGENGLDWLCDFVEQNPELNKNIEVIKATSDDIVRSGLCKTVVKAKECIIAKRKKS